MRTRLALFAASLFAASCLVAAAPAKPSPESPDPGTPRPIESLDTVFIEDMTWMEVRDGLRQGKNTVIVATGGIEQNGPYLATGKHNVVLRATTERIARKLGDALVAPIIPFVPEGAIDPPTAHMRYPGTISLTEDTYRRLLTDICACFRTHGFAHIVLIGDSGENQPGMKAVAAALNDKWMGGKTRAHYIPEYYNYPAVVRWVQDQGIQEIPEGIHDNFAITAMMMTVDPNTVRMNQRIAADRFRINGVDLAPASKTVEWGKKIVNFRADVTVAAIRKALAAQAK